MARFSEPVELQEPECLEPLELHLPFFSISDLCRGGRLFGFALLVREVRQPSI